MGLNLEFCLGNEKKIMDAVKNSNWHFLDVGYGIVQGVADLSFHLSYTDLDLLSKQIGIHSRQNPLELMRYSHEVFHDEGRGVSRIERKWVKYAAQVERAKTAGITRDWYDAMRVAYSDEKIQETDQAVEAVQALCALCQSARQLRNMRSNVMLVWSF